LRRRTTFPQRRSSPFADITFSEMLGKGYGMPSSHSQFVAFFSVSLSLFLLLRHQTTHHTSYRPSTFSERLLVALLACLCAILVAVSRVYLSYHTPKQVWVGFGAGISFALAWFAFTTYLRSARWIDWGLGLEISRNLRFRDLILTEDLQDAGWGRWEDRMAMMKKAVPNGAVSGKKKGR
jgi:dolichyldiphosphatase